MKKSLDKTKPPYSEHILPVPWPFVVSRPRPGEGGGGGYFRNFWGGMCHWDPGTLNPPRLAFTTCGSV